VSSTDYLAARECYEKILDVEPGYVKAYIDLGDQYRNLDANDKALEYYREAVRVLEETPRDEAWKEDAEELLQAVALLTKHDRLAAEASLLEAWCKQSLG
jgi:tetratricopeptide (TPR) repeat protein